MDYGINLQGVSDEKGRFIYIAVAAPGSMHDSKAYQETTLPSLVKNLPPNVFIVADNAYTPTEHLVPVYGGIERAQIGKDDTNYFILQVRIHIERAFGIMKQRFCILKKPLECSFSHASSLVMSIARLHNFCLSESLGAGTLLDFDQINQTDEELINLPTHDYNLLITPGQSMQRQAIHYRVQSMRLRRPGRRDE